MKLLPAHGTRDTRARKMLPGYCFFDMVTESLRDSDLRGGASSVSSGSDVDDRLWISAGAYVLREFQFSGVMGEVDADSCF